MIRKMPFNVIFSNKKLDIFNGVSLIEQKESVQRKQIIFRNALQVVFEFK